MTNLEIWNWIDALERFGSRPGLERITAALHTLGNPQNEFESVLVAGTNGKGSTAAFLATIFSENKYKTAFFPNPHLTDLLEWFQINQQKISKKQFESRAMRLREVSQSNGIELTHFEFLTTLGLQWFADQKTEWAVLECGLGGRLDATNVVNAKAAVITNIALEHQETLGQSKREIAFEKAGIIKKKQPVLTTENDRQILELFSDLATASGSSFFVYGRDFKTTNEEVTLLENRFDFEGFGVKWTGLTTRLVGKHQIQNAALALATGLGLKQTCGIRMSESACKKALYQTVWPGRFEVVSRQPLVILDACHNAHGAQALCETLQTVLPNQKFCLVFGTSYPRKPTDLLTPIARFANEVFFCQAKYKGIPVAELQQAGQAFFPAYKIKTIESPTQAMQRALKNRPLTGAVLATGSIYMLREALKAPALKRLRKNKK